MKPEVPAPTTDLTEKQSAFVQAYVSNGGNGTKAAISAGYARSGAKQEASRLIRNPKVQQAIAQEMQSAFGLAAVQAFAQLSRLLTRAKSEYVRLEAAKDLLSRAGYSLTNPLLSRGSSGLTVQLDIGISQPESGRGGSENVHPASARRSDVEKTSQKHDIIDAEVIPDD